MFIVMSYDVSEKHVHKVLKTAQKYLFPVQRSLFQGHLTPKQLNQLKSDIATLIEPETDKVIFYKSFNDSMLQIDKIGINEADDMIL